MAYKNLFTVLTDEELVRDTLQHAVAAASAYGAHLDVLCLGVDCTQAGYYYAGASALVLQETIEHANRKAKAIGTLVEDILNQTDIRWSVDTGVTQIADTGRHVSARARFSDLVILPKPYGDGRGAELEPVTEAALFDANAPALILPDKAAPNAVRPQRIMVAWNESIEALNAVRAALPLLAGAEDVHVVIVDPPAHGPNRSDPGGMLSQFMARHDVRVDIDVLAKTLPRVSDILARHAIDLDADMMVMGAYGHTQFREAIFGGATRTTLEEANLPVLMAH